MAEPPSIHWPRPHFPEFILQHLPVGLLTVDSELRINYFNPGAEQITGYGQEEALGRSCGEVLMGGECRLECPLRTVLGRRRQAITLETTIMTKDGDRLPVRLRTAAMFDRNGDLIGALEAFSDISQLKALEKERTQTLSFFAHDMKAPLISISGFARRLLEGKAGDMSERQQKYLRFILDQTQQIQALALDFLDVARLGQEGDVLALVEVDLGVLAQRVAEEMEPRAQVQGVDLQVEVSPKLPRIRADVSRLRRALANLLDNALNYAGHGPVRLQVGPGDPGRVEIRVMDQGPGLSPADLDTIFVPFLRGAAARGTDGTGLGLAAVQSIALAHGGQVLAANQPQGGAVFTLVLPVDGAPIPAAGS